MNRCKWCNLKNPLYIKYHDEEWCKPNFDEKYLYEMLILESFQAGLSWECVLNKRQAFEIAYDNFNIEKVCQYDDEKIIELQQNKEIIRNKLKIKASIIGKGKSNIVKCNGIPKTKANISIGTEENRSVIKAIVTLERQYIYCGTLNFLKTPA